MTINLAYFRVHYFNGFFQIFMEFAIHGFHVSPIIQPTERVGLYASIDGTQHLGQPQNALEGHAR